MRMSYPLWKQLEELKSATWVDLTHTFDETIPCFSEFERAKCRHYSMSQTTGSMFKIGML